MIEISNREEKNTPIVFYVRNQNIEKLKQAIKNGADATLLCVRELICFMTIKHSKRTINAIKYNKSAYELLKKYNINYKKFIK